MKQQFRFSVNILIANLVLVGWFLSFFTVGEILSVAGFENLKFYTVLSNLFEGLVCILWSLVYVVTKGKTYRWLEILKYVAATAVFVTFTVVLVFLGPLYGISGMYKNANLFFHLIVPILAVLEAMLLPEYNVNLKDNFFVMIPPLLYGIGYTVNILVNGMGTWPNNNDFYAFLTWGYSVGILIFASIVFLAFVLGFAIRLLRKNIADGFRREKKAALCAEKKEEKE